MKILSILSVLFMSSFAQASKISSYACQTGTDLQVQLLVFNDRTTEEGKIYLDAFKLGLSNEYISNLHLKAVAAAPAVAGPNGNEYVFNMDLDPYNGKVGTFVWTFYVPEAFAVGSAQGTITDPSKIPMMSWQGTPIGEGNNSGVGRYSWVSCKKVQ